MASVRIENPKTMRAVVWEGRPYSVSVQDLPVPTLQTPNDAIVRVTSAAICGSDLHTYRGLFGSENPPWGLGHEAVGVVTSVGDGVKTIQVGDRVIVPDAPDDGHLNPHFPKDDFVAFGFGRDFGDLGGCQAEFVRVPYADNSLVPIPKTPSRELDYLFVSDIFATGWTALDFAGFQPGETVAIFGAGPVGLLCAYSAFLRGASKVYVVDHVENRLAKAAEIGAIPINFSHSNAATQILELEPNGVDRCCDCCGDECLNENLKPQQNAIINDMVRATVRDGGIGIIGVYAAQKPAPGRPEAGKVAPVVEFPLTDVWLKNLSIKAGVVDPKPLAGRLMDLISNGRARPSFIVSSVISIEDAVSGYKRFEKHKETKVVIRFPWQAELEVRNGTH